MSIPDSTLYRIVDANLNRAREALRVMEEYARFALDDAGLSAAIKQLRHAVSTCPPGAVAGALSAHRDILGDVGRDVSVPTEYERSDVAQVAELAAKRLGEALRVIEEYGKAIEPGFGAAVERIRYRAYDLERRLCRTIRARSLFGQVRLYVLLTESRCAGDWLSTAEAMLTSGVDCLQLREKHLGDRELLGRARRLASLCRERGTLFIVNDRPDIALLSAADGVHLGQDDVTVADARRVLPARAIVGASAHSADQVAAAAESAPDYIAVGPMFDSPTKPRNQIAGPAELRAAREHTSLPLVAIGGITADNASEVLGAARCALCVCTSVVSQPDVAIAAARLRGMIDQFQTLGDTRETQV